MEVPVSRFEGNRGLPIAARAGGHLPTRGAEFPPIGLDRVEPLDMEGAVLVVRRPAVIEGTVRDGDGRVIPGAEVHFGERPRPDGTFGSKGSTLRADREGRVRYELDAEDDSSVDAHAVAFGVEGPRVELHGGFIGGGTVKIDIPVPARGEDRFSGRGPWVLAGRVVDGDGRPVAGAEVKGALVKSGDDRGWTRRTGPDGAFEVLLEGEWYPQTSVTVASPGFAPRRVRIEEPVRAALRLVGRFDGVEVVLAPGAVLEGRALDEKGPIPGASIGLSDREEDADPDTRGWGHPDFFGADRRIADREGRFRFEALEARDDLVLFVRAEGRTPTPFRLAGALKAGEVLARDFEVKPIRTVPLEVRLAGWRKGVEVRLDHFDRVPVAETWKTTVTTGIHEIEVVDGNGHGLETRRFFADPDEEGVVMEIQLPACDRCAEDGE